MVRHLVADASFSDYSMMYSTYYRQLLVEHQQNTLLDSSFQLILTTDHTWFRALHQNAMYELKQVFLLYVYVTGFMKIDHNVTFRISRNTILKH